MKTIYRQWILPAFASVFFVFLLAGGKSQASKFEQKSRQPIKIYEESLMNFSEEGGGLLDDGVWEHGEKIFIYPTATYQLQAENLMMASYPDPMPNELEVVSSFDRELNKLTRQSQTNSFDKTRLGMLPTISSVISSNNEEHLWDLINCASMPNSKQVIIDDWSETSEGRNQMKNPNKRSPSLTQGVILTGGNYNDILIQHLVFLSHDIYAKRMDGELNIVES